MQTCWLPFNSNPRLLSSVALLMDHYLIQLLSKSLRGIFHWTGCKNSQFRNQFVYFLTQFLNLVFYSFKFVAVYLFFNSFEGFGIYCIKKHSKSWLRSLSNLTVFHGLFGPFYLTALQCLTLDQDIKRCGLLNLYLLCS